MTTSTPPPYGAPLAKARKTNGMAIASLIFSFLFAPLGIIFGHISLSQIKRSGEDGRGMAITGLVVGYVLTVVSIIVAIGMVIFLWVAGEALSGFASIFVQRPDSPSAAADPVPPTVELPPFNPPADLGANCTYEPTTGPADQRATPPPAGQVPTAPAVVNATVVTNQGVIGLHLDNAQSPCTVNSFTNLIRQAYFNGTSCPRLTTEAELSVLQCGDPSRTGDGGPGYQFADEYPTSQYRSTDPALEQNVTYPRGTLAMANSGPGTNGSQFFIVYADSQLPPKYTVFGTVDETGLATAEKIASSGIDGGGLEGKPALDVEITSAQLDGP